MVLENERDNILFSRSLACKLVSTTQELLLQALVLNSRCKSIVTSHFNAIFHAAKQQQDNPCTIRVSVDCSIIFSK